MRVRWWRVGRGLVVGVLVLYLCALGFVQVSQRVLRRRAERLAADVSGLRVGMSGFGEFERVRAR